MTAPLFEVNKQHIELPIEGMTCASCAARIERKLNRLDGVTASVNYATEKATVEFDPNTSTAGDLIAAVEAAGYKATIPQPEATGSDEAGSMATDSTATLRQRLVISTLLGLPVLALAMIPALQFDNWQWASLTLAAPVVVWGGWPFHRAAFANLRHRTATMDTLVSVGTIAAFAWSLWALFLGDAGHPGMKMTWSFDLHQSSGSHEIYLEVAAVVTLFLLAGRYFEARAKRRSGAAIKALTRLGAKDVAVLEAGGSERRLPVDVLEVGMRFVVRPGEKVATDGRIIEGTSAINTSLITGESVPVDVKPGDAVIGATLNTSGRLIVEATKVGADTTLAAMARMVEAAQSGKAPVQRLADRVSAIFVPTVIILAAATLAYWLINGAEPAFAFGAAVAVLIVACPCALGLATPTALLVGTGRGAQLGILINGPEVLEDTRRIDTIVLDKTGTVTTGTMRVVETIANRGNSEGDVLRYAAAVEAASEHPIAHAIALAGAAGGRLPAVDEFINREGLGVQGMVDGKLVVAGKPALLELAGFSIDHDMRTALELQRSQGRTAVLVAWDGRARGVIAVADAVKPTSKAAIASLRKLGLEPILLTGDNENTANEVARATGITNVIAGVLPQDKLSVIRDLQTKSKVVAMVGDGVNDALALTQADLGIAMGTGTEVAIAASNLTIVGGDLRATADAIALSRRTLTTIKVNLFWAFGYNIAALPLAAAGYLNPLIAGAAMVSSSVFVVSNSLRLRRFKLHALCISRT